MNDIWAGRALPDDLTERDQWLLWRYENNTKVPYTCRGRKASSTDPAMWTSFEEVHALLVRVPKLYNGPGFVFCADDPFVGIDLDDALDAAEVKPWAQAIVELFADSYCEISPSGRGLKIWVRGKLPANLAKVRMHGGGVELYDHARYFAVTGQAFRGAPLHIENHTQDVLDLYKRLLPSGGGAARWPLQPLEGGRIPFGRQHSTLISILGTLRARNLCDEAIEACLQIVNERQCERPGPRENISRMVRSSGRWGAPAR